MGDPRLIRTRLCCRQVDKLEEAESQRKTEEEVTEPQPMVFGRFTKLVWWDLCLSVSVPHLGRKRAATQRSERGVNIPS